ncbi:SMI1/KNR4 family protein [Erythrobacter sp. JK5]|uniref:SMI1/KNR4 family protein n=1 Tax=Erythrobacter sp. JK5 TaxID=2829500 RepID=UPI001BAAC48E|nr:SMI1/KNR4 family protein [Erythrobacter sp. JK5]QUL37215.1 SMI1/KNR4 family protein [Erythrobacter sp. JK5]
MDVTATREKLRVLGDREWPEEWGFEQAGDDFLGWSHRYRLDTPLDTSEVESFERQHAVALPADYRQFLIELGNGGAGPGYGIWPLGEGENGPLPDEMLANLSQPFAHTEPWNENGLPDEEYYSYSVIAGALEIATDGDALYYFLVLNGPAAGQVWYDRRTDGKGLGPVRDAGGAIMTFGPWYEAWLGLALDRFASE